MFKRNPPLRTDDKIAINPHTFATAFDGVTIPSAMHSALLATFASTFTSVNHDARARYTRNDPPCKPTSGYVTTVKNIGGKTLNTRTSNNTTDVKYAFTPYAPLARSLKKSSRSSRHTGRDDSDMSARYRRMKKSDPMRF